MMVFTFHGKTYARVRFLQEGAVCAVCRTKSAPAEAVTVIWKRKNESEVAPSAEISRNLMHFSLFFTVEYKTRELPAMTTLESRIVPLQVKCFATSISICLTCLISVGFMGMALTETYVIGTILVSAHTMLAFCWCQELTLCAKCSVRFRL